MPKTRCRPPFDLFFKSLGILLEFPFFLCFPVEM